MSKMAGLIHSIATDKMTLSALIANPTAATALGHLPTEDSNALMRVLQENPFSLVQRNFNDDVFKDEAASWWRFLPPSR